MSERRVLAVFSARLDETARQSVARGAWPRKDFFELVRALDADVLDIGAVERSRAGRALARLLGMPRAQAALAFARRGSYDAVFTDGEHIGLPLGALLRLPGPRPRHTTIGHLLNTRPKRALCRWLRADAGVDLFVLHAVRQRQAAAHELGIAPERLLLAPYQADAAFWQPRADAATDEPLICAAGLEYRDYATLAAAANGLPARVVIAAGSRWSQHRDGTAQTALPSNVTITSLDYAGLRALYARSRFVTVPLRPTDNQAGVTTILEAMAMEKAVIVTATAGQRDVVRGRLCTAAGPTGASFGGPAAFGIGGALAEAETGLYVPPGDAAALRTAMRYLLERPDEARRMGEAGRRLVTEAMGVERYAERIAAVVRGDGATRGALTATAAAGGTS